MNIKEIEVLLGKYYNGETTLDEEKQLKDFFLHEPVPVHLESEAELFRYLNSASDQNMDDPDFDRKFMESIETPVIPIHSSRNQFYFALSLAASILLLVGFLFTFRDAIYKQPLKNSITDPQLAYTETKKALMLVSVNFNAGLDQMWNLSTFYKYQPLIINQDDQGRQIKK